MLMALTLVNVRASNRSSEEVKALLQKVGVYKWPRLRIVRISSFRDSDDKREPNTVAWEALRKMLRRWGWQDVNEKEVRTVVAGVSFLAAPKFSRLKPFASEEDI